MRKLNVTDRQTDRRTDGRTGGAMQYLPSRAFGAAGDNKFYIYVKTLTSLAIWGPGGAGGGGLQ